MCFSPRHGVSIGYDWFYHELSHGPGRPGAVKRPQRFPMKIHFDGESVWARGALNGRKWRSPARAGERALVEDGMFRAGLGVGLACWCVIIVFDL